MAASRVLAGGQLAHNLAALPPGARIMSSIQYFRDEYIGHDLGGLPLRPGGLDPAAHGAVAARFSSPRAPIRGYPSTVIPCPVSPRGDPRRAHFFDTAIIVFMLSTVAIERPANWPAAVPFAAAGAACVVAGGLVAAATALAPSQLASWTTAYLVLVGGVAQAALGAGQALLIARPPGRPGIAAELTAWNAGNGAVLAGTLLGASWLADVGGVLLAAVLALMIAATRGAARQPAWPLHLYRALAALVLVSIPAGLVIAGLRPH